MKRINLKDLCHYAPYGLAIANISLKDELVSVYIMDVDNNNEKGIMNVINGANQLPLLYPLSAIDHEFPHISYTKELEPGLEKIIPNEFINKHWHTKIRPDGHFSTQTSYGTCIGYKWKSCRVDIILLLSEWKIDYMGLINNGLAKDVTILDKNPYL